MTFREFMQENGYDLITTFWEDFSIADKYGIAGVKDTYKRAFSEWKGNYKFFTELTLVLNHKIWQHYESNRELAALYDRLWREADEYAMNNFEGEELDYYYRIYKSQQEIQKVNPLYAFKVATAYFREQGKVPIFEDSNCRLIKL